MPEDVQAACTEYGQLLHDHVDDLTPEDVQDFAAALMRRCSELLQGEGEEGEDGDECGGCAMCERQMPLTFHHLIPRYVCLCA